MVLHVIRALAAAMLPVSLAAGAACSYPDEGNMPLRRAVTRVDLLPETIAWSRAERRNGLVVHFAVLLEETISAAGRCHWTVEARAGERVWQRFYVTPDGKNLLVDGVHGKPVTLDEWRGKARPAASPATLPAT